MKTAVTHPITPGNYNAGSVYVFTRSGNTGAAYIFAYENGSWGQQAKLTADTGASGDQFGFFVGLSGSYAVAGAPQDDDAGSNAGSAYTFVAAGGGGGGGGLQTTTIAYGVTIFFPGIVTLRGC